MSNDNISKSDEYASIRNEMLQRFDRIHDIIKFLISFYVIFLSFYFLNNFSHFIATLIPLIVIFVIGIWILPYYKSIFNQGSYISIVLENNNENKYHKMSRDLINDIKKGDILYPNKCSTTNFIEGKYWGQDFIQTGKLLIILLATGLFTVSYKFFNEKTYDELIKYLSNSCFYFKLFLLLIILLFDIFIIILFFRLNKFIDNNKSVWIKKRTVSNSA